MAKAEKIPDLKSVRSGEDLARFISTMITNDAALGVFLQGLDNTNSIHVAPDAIPIPIREIYGTIVGERFQNALGENFYERGKKYGVREICSFRDSKGELRRFHIIIFEESQYYQMKDLLKRKTHRTP